MLRIAICDDMPNELKNLVLMTNQYISAESLDAKVTEFSHTDALSLAISKVDLADEQTFTVKTADSMRVLKLSEIVCCEYRNHAVIFSLANNDEVVSRTIWANYSEYILTILKDSHFLQCHSSFVVNMRRVERFAKDSFTLSGGKIVPISTKQYPIVFIRKTLNRTKPSLEQTSRNT
ncbi:MAG: LytTr DNA-binding domain protein [Firmicutes bacterium ADurb.Bin419]|nr:MAG: LytTr DNA-binding domain protein [Firmicutes bacterium ADurb.Bin419]